MFTAAKAVAALFFAVFGYIAAYLVLPLLPEGSSAAYLNETVAASGLLMGWRVSGRNAGNGYRAAAGYGLTTVVLMVFWSILAFAGYEMLQNAMRLRYNGAMQALVGLFAIGIDYGKMIATFEIIATGIGGAVIGGWVTEWASKRWL